MLVMLQRVPQIQELAEIEDFLVFGALIFWTEIIEIIGILRPQRGANLKFP